MHEGSCLRVLVCGWKLLWVFVSALSGLRQGSVRNATPAFLPFEYQGSPRGAVPVGPDYSGIRLKSPFQAQIYRVSGVRRFMVDKDPADFCRWQM